MEIVIKPSIKDVWKKAFDSIPFFASEILELQPHPDQERALKGIRKATRSFIKCGNRWGKGELALMQGAHKAAFKIVPAQFKSKDCSILNASISQDQANIVFDKFQSIADKPKFSWLLKDIKRSPFPHVIFKNGMTWWFRNASQEGKFLEGRSYAHLNFDEADLMPEFRQFTEETLEPRLWDFNGTFCAMTTPRRGKRNAYKLWKDFEDRAKTQPEYFVFSGDSRENSYLPPEAIERMNALPRRLFDKNVLAKWEAQEGSISTEAVDFCIRQASGLRSDPEKEKRYVNVWDFARSTTWCVGLTIEDSSPYQIRNFERFQDPAGHRTASYWKTVENRIRLRAKTWGGPTIVDQTGLGDVVASYISDINPVMANFGRGQLREDMIAHGIGMTQRGEFGLPHCEQVTQGEVWTAEDELRDFEPDQAGNIWDFVCCLFMGLWYLKGKKFPGNEEKAAPTMSPRAHGIPRR